MSLLSKLLPKKLLPCRIGEEEGFLDVDVPLISLAVGSAGEIRAIARGEVGGLAVGFAVLLHPQWQAQPIEGGGATFYWGTGAFERTGKESDDFVAFVAGKYELATAGKTLAMLPSVDVEIVGLDSDPSQSREWGAKMKFFLHSDSDDRYAEVFLNINLEESLVEFREKDNEYRAPLLRALIAP